MKDSTLLVGRLRGEEAVSERAFIIALDPGTSTGFACSNGCHGVRDLAPLKAAPKKKREAEPEYARCGKLWALLHELVVLPPITPSTTVVCEGAFGFMKGKNAVRVSNEIRGVVKAWAWTFGAAYVEVQPTDLQRFVTGRGQVPKEEMLRLAQERYGYAGEDDNVGDALHLLAWAKANITK